jgi:hypothetical protein
MFSEEPSEAAGVRGVEANELIQEERRRLREVGLPLRVESTQLRVCLYWRPTRGQPLVERALDWPPSQFRRS